jgi:hypothetical protein
MSAAAHGPSVAHTRCPNGDSLSEVRIRVMLAEQGQPVMDLRVFRREMDDFTPEGLRPTSQAITIPLSYSPVLIDAITRAALAFEDPRT